MAVPQRIHSNERIDKWWQNIQYQYRGILQLARANKRDLNRLYNLQNTLYQSRQAYDVFVQSPFPPEATEIRRHMLALMTNLVACLQHASNDNLLERDVLFDVMKVDSEMLETALMENDISPLS